MPRNANVWDGRRRLNVESMVAGGRSVLPPCGDSKRDAALHRYHEQQQADPSAEIPEWADRILKRCQPHRIENMAIRAGGLQS